MAAEMDVQAFVFASATCSLWRNADKLLLPDRYGKRGTTGADLRVKKKASANLCRPLCVKCFSLTTGNQSAFMN